MAPKSVGVALALANALATRVGVVVTAAPEQGETRVGVSGLIFTAASPVVTAEGQVEPERGSVK